MSIEVRELERKGRCNCCNRTIGTYVEEGDRELVTVFPSQKHPYNNIIICKYCIDELDKEFNNEVCNRKNGVY